MRRTTLTVIPSGTYEENVVMVTLTFTSWNVISGWLTRIDIVRQAA